MLLIDFAADHGLGEDAPATALRGGRAAPIGFDENQIVAPNPNIDLIALDDVLYKSATYEAHNAELVRHHNFAGLTYREAA